MKAENNGIGAHSAFGFGFGNFLGRIPETKQDLERHLPRRAVPGHIVIRAEPEIKSPCKTLARAFIGLQSHFFHAARENAARQGIVPIGRELYHGEIRYAQRRPRLWQFLYIACNPLLLQRTFKRPAPTLQLSRMPRAHSFRKSPKSGVSQI